MVSLTTASTHLIISRQNFIDFNTHFFPSCFLVFNAKRRANKREKFVSLSLVAGKESGSGGGSLLGFVEVKRRDCRCKNWDCEGDFALEAEILEFMKESEKPEVFPSKKELVDAGRRDLMEAIVRQGGWLVSGWDLDDEEKEEEEKFGGSGFDVKDWDLKMMESECCHGAVESRVESDEESSSLEGSERSSFGVSSFAVNSSGSASSSGRSLETATNDDSGIEGILSRLEKERNMNFGFGLRERGSSARIQIHGSQDDWLAGISTDATVVALKEAGELHNHSGGKLSQNRSLSGIDGLRNSHKPEMWRTWSIQRAGFSDMEFEAAEISSNETEEAMDVSVDEILEIRESGNEPLNRKKEFNSSHEEINHNQLRSRLQHLELELSSVLHSLRSNTDEVASQKGNESSSDDYQELSDAWEFQENEIMNAQDKIRSIRAKLAVLEGKMALAIIDAQKMVEEKQKRIDDARRALRLLRTASIVWPNSASEVLLAGSYDGWSTQRKMEKSSTGIFSLCLKLYPGRYEIKFIVDGEWRIDPLRPIVHNNGYENNLLIIM